MRFGLDQIRGSKLLQFVLVVSLAAFVAGVGLGISAAADGPKNARQFVTVPEQAPVTILRGKPGKVAVEFKVNEGFHINSHKPTSELLIPTEIAVTSDAGLKLGRPTYPAGHEFALSFAPQEKLSVYTGVVKVTLPVAATRKAGEYKVAGEIKYQACSENACFPPKSAPFEVKVVVR